MSKAKILRKLLPKKPKPKNNYVKVPMQAFKDEEKYEQMMRDGKKLSDTQLKAYSKAVKLTTDKVQIIDDIPYVTRTTKDKTVGTVSHALNNMDFLSKSYLNLYKQKPKNKAR